jgi:hypothetical protein
MKRIIAVGILVTFGLLSGCNSTAFLYNNAPWLVREQVDDYFSITGIQEQQLDRDIGLFFKWHRYQELPGYAEFLLTFNQQFADGLTREELTLSFDQLAAARVRFATASLHSASQFLASIDNEQLERFDGEFKQRLSEDRERTELSVEQQRQENYDRLLDSLEDWFGDIDEKQQQTVRLISDARPDSYAQWLDRREQRQAKLLQFLRRKPEAPAIKSYLHSQYVKTMEQNTDNIQNNFRQFWLLAMLKIDQIITPAQRQQAMHRLDDYRQDFIQLSEQKIQQKRIEIER